MITISRRLQAVAGLFAIASFGALAALPASAAVIASPHSPSAIRVIAPAPAIGSTGTAMSRQAVIPSVVLDEECGGDVCMTLNEGSIIPLPFIQAGANSNGFDGYFHLSGPGGPFHPANSPTNQWPAHGVAAGGNSVNQWNFDSFQSGVYCVAAFQSNGTMIGKACASWPPTA